MAPGISGSTSEPLIHPSEAYLVVISGAAGFIGRRFAAQARAYFPDAEMLCYATTDNTDYARTGKRCLAQKRLCFAEADFLTGMGLLQVEKHPRFVFHLAASSATRQRNHQCNDVGTRNFIRSLKGLGPGSHVLYTSSIAVMDSRRDYTTPLTEETLTLGPPLTEYGISKKNAEIWLREEARATGFSLSILRPVTVYGPGARPDSVLEVLKRHSSMRTILSRLDWPGMTGLVHVEDVGNVLLALAGKPPPPGTSETYLVQAEVRSLAQISEMIYKRLNMPRKPIRLPAFLWRMIFNGGRFALRLDSALPAKIYGDLWRLRLVSGNVFWCDGRKLRTALPEWTPSMLEEKIMEVLGH